MREILFKAKRVDNGEWIEGQSLIKMIKPDGLYIASTKPNSVVVTMGENTDNIYKLNTTNDGEPIMFKIIPETLGQFVEREDTSGTKIFEGDKVEIITSNNVGDTCITRVTVSFDDLNTLNAINYSHEIYIIGNIHDNPELLEEQQ